MTREDGAGSIRLEQLEPGIARLTLDRPAKLNALDVPMLDDLATHLETLERDTALRCILLEAEGARAFCAGADIAAWGALEPLDMWRRWIADGNRLFDRLARLRQPVVAAIDGIAFGGGLELALCADIRVAGPTARLALPETSVGTIPGWSGIRRTVRLVGLARAKQLVLTGRPIDAETALSFGLIAEISDDAKGRALALAREIAARAPIATQLAKALLDQAANEEPGIAIQGIASALAAFTADGIEGTAAFKEKRPPRFTGS